MINPPVGRSNLSRVLSALGHHLVFAEGVDTELFYAKSIEKEILGPYKLNAERNQVEVIEIDKDNSGFNTLSLVKRVEEEVTARIRAGQKIDYVWIFFDKDQFPMKNYKEAIARTERHNRPALADRNLNEEACDEDGIHWTPCYSNVCFELWVLLYFSFKFLFAPEGMINQL